MISFCQTFLGSGSLSHLPHPYPFLLMHICQPGPPLAGKYCNWLPLESFDMVTTATTMVVKEVRKKMWMKEVQKNYEYQLREKRILTCTVWGDITIICDRLWQKQAFGLKISFVNFSLELINNNFWLKCWKNYYSIFMGSRDMNFIMLFYSEVQFREKRMQSLLIQ